MTTNKIIIIVSVTVVTVVVITIALLVVLLRSDGNLVVNTNSGLVRGVEIRSDISNFKAFYSIPYAMPPINELRFKAPVPIQTWEGEHDGTFEGPVCAQAPAPASTEDCLTLSVYTTDVAASGKPVMVYLHGGALEAGSARISTYGPHYFMKHDIVVVVVQFRLNMFGFLNLNMEGAPGNMALADAIEALKWTRDNIRQFGGDPARVTLAGLSSGGIMTHALLLSPHAQGLFHKIIIQSGTSLSYRFYTDEVEPNIEQTKAVLNMENTTHAHLLEHLKTLETSNILNITTSIKNWYPTGYANYFPYSISRDYFGILPSNPLELIQENNYENIPMLIGVTSDEGNRLETLIDRIDFVNENFYMVVPTDLYPIDDMSIEKNETALAIKEFYFGTEDLSYETFDKYAELCTDSWYGHITDYVVRLQASLNYSAPVYYYRFAVDGAYNKLKIADGLTRPGASHADDNGYLWRSDDLADVVPDDDYSDLSRERMVALFSNFVKTSNPTPEINEMLPVRWETLQYPTMNYFLINSTLSLEQNPERERLLFWQSLYGWREL